VARSTTRRAARVVVLCVCALSVAALFGATVRQALLMNSAVADVVEKESSGAQMLHPMTTLVGELVGAQSTAVRGEKVDGEALRKALAGVEGVGEEYGGTLQTNTRLVELTAAVETALRQSDTGAAAYETYTSLVRLAVDMVHQIGDTSHLIHDPDLDSFYLMDAAIIRLPDATVLAGRAADLVAMAGATTLEGENLMRAAVARYGVSAAAEQVTTGLQKSVEITTRSELSSRIAERLDAFRAAADAFAPPTMLSQLAGSVNAATLAANARQVYATAVPLAHRLLFELQALLDQRAKKLAGERRLLIISAVAASVLGLVMLWLLVLPRRRAGGGEAAAGSSGGDETRIGSLRYAREILEAEEELVHVGRAVRARPRERDDAQ